MSTNAAPTPREKRFQARRRRILDIAARLAEEEGWIAVTTRRLAEAIDYSQPVIYQHFTDRDDLIRTLVVEGFEELTVTIHRVLDTATDARLAELCRAYVEFGTARPQRYEAMFSLPTTLQFADADTPPELRHSFNALASVVQSETPSKNSEQIAELFWACCHGLVSLINANRIPADRIEQHIHAIGAIVSQNPDLHT